MLTLCSRKSVIATFKMIEERSIATHTYDQEIKRKVDAFVYDLFTGAKGSEILGSG